jgi:hypothetical protein
MGNVGMIFLRGWIVQQSARPGNTLALQASEYFGSGQLKHLGKNFLHQHRIHILKYDLGFTLFGHTTLEHI